MKRHTIITVLLLSILTIPGFSQNLFQNDELRQSRQLQIEAQKALDQGDYEHSIELSRRADELAAEGKRKAEEMALAYRANTLLNRAKARIDYVRLIGAAERVADRYAEAQEAYAKAKEALDQKAYEQSMTESQRVLSILEGIAPQRAGNAKVLPKYYTVRLIPKRRDCFWRIAEYDFIYGDPHQWKELYKANKDKLVDPDNPSLIHPGLVLEIPSLNGEVRRGTWKE
ncbi:LysM peptidoglycan-binding domain-containing protein [Sediminispirochaeta bajacaliforniensis]|uniref:LysM peptidoglycan-binding domain-containing protein n=1 Tax=Sediminispirochaeta bajacaliforniensis TaxID=148 RepID=UPI000367F125|nr:hypothetical protein [Sediminispirochaeta bajacaliforniensis]